MKWAFSYLHENAETHKSACTGITVLDTWTAYNKLLLYQHQGVWGNQYYMTVYVNMRAEFYFRVYSPYSASIRDTKTRRLVDVNVLCMINLFHSDSVLTECSRFGLVLLSVLMCWIPFIFTLPSPIPFSPPPLLFSYFFPFSSFIHPSTFLHFLSFFPGHLNSSFCF
jgi:hypothetical protein